MPAEVRKDWCERNWDERSEDRTRAEAFPPKGLNRLETRLTFLFPKITVADTVAGMGLDRLVWAATEFRIPLKIQKQLIRHKPN